MLKINIYILIAGCLLIVSQAAFVHNASARENFDLIWEAKTYTPSFYEGKPLATQGSEIDINVISLNNELQKKTYIYNWYIATEYQGYRFQKEKSGLGKQNFSFKTKIRAGNKDIINLEIIDSDNENMVYTASLEIPISNPEIKIYKNDDAKNNLYTKQNKITVSLNYNEEIIYYFKALPFFFLVEKQSQLDYAWEMDQKFIQNSQFLEINIQNNQKQKILFNKVIFVKASRSIAPMQSAENSFNLVFD